MVEVGGAVDAEWELSDNNMEAAAEVVEAIAVADTGSGWLWVPS